MKMSVRGKFVWTLAIVSLLTFGATLLHAWRSFRKLGELAVGYEKIAGDLAVKESNSFLTATAREELRQDAVDQARTAAMGLSFCADLLRKAAEEGGKAPALSFASIPAYPYGAKVVSPPGKAVFFYPSSLSPQARIKAMQFLIRFLPSFQFMYGKEFSISNLYAAAPNGVLLTFGNGKKVPEKMPFFDFKRKWGASPESSCHYAGTPGKGGAWVYSHTLAIPSQSGSPRGILSMEMDLFSLVGCLLSDSGSNSRKMNFFLDASGRFLAGNPAFIQSFASGEKAAFFTPEANDRLLQRNPALAESLKNIQNGKSGTVLVREADGEKEYFIGYAPVGAFGLSIGVLQEKDSLLAAGKALGEKLAQQRLRSRASFQGIIYRELLDSGLLLLLLLFLLLLVAYFIGRQMSKPICKLIENARIIGSGDLSFRSEIKTGDELEKLSDTLNRMSDSLKKYIDELHKAAAERVRIKTELKAAARIQSSMLPSALPGTSRLALAGKMLPAREVGGDLYDYLLLDGGRKLYFTIGDVSGKGIPASLFMAKAQNVMRLLAMRGEDPEEILRYTNLYLEKENPDCMFLTAFCGVLDLENGHLVCCNAGHNPPLFLRKEGCHFRKGHTGLVLGVFPEGKEKLFCREEFQLEKGEGLLLYTDGVTEAEDPAAQQYGKEALLALVETWRREGKGVPGSLLDRILESVHAFADGASQSDDITLLYLEYTGKETK